MIEFAPVGERVQVSCTYSPAQAVCEPADLRATWLGFRQDVLSRLKAQYPRLAVNPALVELQS